MPPCPVTTTKLMKTTEYASPPVSRPSQNSSTMKNTHTVNSATARAHGHARRQRGRSSAQLMGGAAVVTEPPLRALSRDIRSRPTRSSTNGTELPKPWMSSANVA
jgi:hypothetical protein